MLTPEQQTTLSNYRSKVLNKTITREEMLDGIKILRESRANAQAQQAAGKRVTAKKAPVDVKALFDQLDQV